MADKEKKKPGRAKGSRISSDKSLIARLRESTQILTTTGVGGGFKKKSIKGKQGNALELEAWVRGKPRPNYAVSAAQSGGEGNIRKREEKRRSPGLKHRQLLRISSRQEKDKNRKSLTHSRPEKDNRKRRKGDRDPVEIRAEESTLVKDGSFRRRKV